MPNLPLLRELHTHSAYGAGSIPVPSSLGLSSSARRGDSSGNVTSTAVLSGMAKNKHQNPGMGHVPWGKVRTSCCVCTGHRAGLEPQLAAWKAWSIQWGCFLPYFLILCSVHNRLRFQNTTIYNGRTTHTFIAEAISIPPRESNQVTLPSPSRSCWRARSPSRAGKMLSWTQLLLPRLSTSFSPGWGRPHQGLMLCC